MRQPLEITKETTPLRTAVGETRIYRYLRARKNGIVQRIGKTALGERLAHWKRIRCLRQDMKRTRPLRVVVGAGGFSFSGWFSTDIDLLDIRSPRDWSRLFERGTIDRLLVEHVLEHLSYEENRVALSLCYQYLRRGGTVRIAVPDGYRRDKSYVDEVSPPNDGHKVLFDVDCLTSLLQEVGFKPVPLEFYDRDECFHASSWQVSDGHVRRSVRFDRQQQFRRGDHFYTSLMIDAHKE